MYDKVIFDLGLQKIIAKEMKEILIDLVDKDVKVALEVKN